MKSKTFKIGEYCKGGVITAIITKNVTTIIGKDWDFSAGSNKGSNQSNAKEFARWTVQNANPFATNNLREVLNDLTTSYYAEQVLEWIEKSK